MTFIQFLCGVGMMLLMASLWVASTQFLKSTYTGLLSPPLTPHSASAHSSSVFSWEWLQSLPFNVTAAR